MMERQLQAVFLKYDIVAAGILEGQCCYTHSLNCFHSDRLFTLKKITLSVGIKKSFKCVFRTSYFTHANVLSLFFLCICGLVLFIKYFLISFDLCLFLLLIPTESFNFQNDLRPNLLICIAQITFMIA